MALIEALYRFGVFGANMPLSQMLANHGSVLGCHQAAVIGVPGPRLGLFHQQLIEQLRQGMVDEIAAVIGMKAPDSKRKLAQHGFRDRNQPGFANPCRWPFPDRDALI
jgi:hypothetical protein